MKKYLLILTITPILFTGCANQNPPPPPPPVTQTTPSTTTPPSQTDLMPDNDNNSLRKDLNRVEKDLDNAIPDVNQNIPETKLDTPTMPGINMDENNTPQLTPKDKVVR